MKTKSKWLAAIVAFAVAFVMLLGLLPAALLHSSAQGVSEESNADDGLLTSNLVKDGSFENVTAEDTGDWDVDVSSDAAGTKGSWELVEGAENVHSGTKAITLKGAGNDSGYPEISQQMTVLPNTTYYVTIRLKNNNTAMSSANLFFGFASPERDGETIYGEQHRWADNSVDKDHIYQEDGAWSEHNGYSLISARLKTGNETNVRFYIRLQKMNATIDDVTITYAQDIVSTGSENLLKNPGFEDSTNANPLADWITIGETTNGFSAGIDDVRTTSAYTPGSNMQDKQIEGCNALYLVANSGANGAIKCAYGPFRRWTYGEHPCITEDGGRQYIQNMHRGAEAVFRSFKTEGLKGISATVRGGEGAIEVCADGSDKPFAKIPIRIEDGWTEFFAECSLEDGVHSFTFSYNGEGACDILEFSLKK